jgi:hypothetical protein
MLLAESVRVVDYQDRQSLVLLLVLNGEMRKNFQSLLQRCSCESISQYLLEGTAVVTFVGIDNLIWTPSQSLSHRIGNIVF